jgi:hypothetical protein
VLPSPRDRDVNAARLRSPRDPCYVHRLIATSTQHASARRAIRATFAAAAIGGEHAASLPSFATLIRNAGR